MEATQEYLHDTYKFDHENGKFFKYVKSRDEWKEVKASGKHFTTKVHMKPVYMPKLAWMYVYGEFPKGNLGYKDGDMRNIAIDNLVPLWNTGELTQEKLRQLFSYNHLTGSFYRRYAMGGEKAGEITSTMNDGYIVCKIFSQTYLVHRLIWLYEHGSMPVGIIDHIDHNRTNNKLSNLRDVSRKDNAKNMKDRGRDLPMNIQMTDNERFKVCVRDDTTNRYFGTYDTMDEAIAARDGAKIALGFHGNHGK